MMSRARSLADNADAADSESGISLLARPSAKATESSQAIFSSMCMSSVCDGNVFGLLSRSASHATQTSATLTHARTSTPGPANEEAPPLANHKQGCGTHRSCDGGGGAAVFISPTCETSTRATPTISRPKPVCCEMEKVLRARGTLRPLSVASAQRIVRMRPVGL